MIRTILIQVACSATVQDVRRAVMVALGETRLSEVKLVSKKGNE